MCLIWQFDYCTEDSENRCMNWHRAEFGTLSGYNLEVDIITETWRGRPTNEGRFQGSGLSRLL